MSDSNNEIDFSIIENSETLLQRDILDYELEAVQEGEEFPEIEKLLEEEWGGATFQDDLVSQYRTPRSNGEYCNELDELRRLYKVDRCQTVEDEIQLSSNQGQLENASIIIDSNEKSRPSSNNANLTFSLGPRIEGLVESVKLPCNVDSTSRNNGEIIPVVDVSMHTDNNCEESQQVVDESNGDINMSIETVHQVDPAVDQMQDTISRDEYPQPAADLPIDKNKVEAAMEHFYDAAFNWFNLSSRNIRSEQTMSDPICHGGYLPGGHELRQFIVPKSSIRELIETEMRLGNDVSNESLIKSFAKHILDNEEFAYMCPSCQTFFKTPESFKKHFIWRTGWKGAAMDCPYCCSWSFTNLYALKRHMKSQHWYGSEKYEVEPGVFMCNEEGCGRQFPTRKGLSAHLMGIHKSGTNLCRLCRTQFESKGALREHLISKHGIRQKDSLRERDSLPYRCDVEGCNMRCRTENGIIQHKRAKHKRDHRVENGKQ